MKDALVDRFRMAVWLIAGLAFYALAYATGNNYPAVQTVFYKLGHVTTLAWVGYWISRQAVGRVDMATTSPIEKMARAMLMGAVIIAGSMGL